MNAQKDYKSVKDSGKREEFNSGSKRDSRLGKGRFDLLPGRAMKRLAKHFENGAVKYGDNNWQKGQPISRYMDSAMRHIFCYLMGMDDEDHLVAGAWNLMCACETEERCLEGSLDPIFNDMAGFSFKPIEAPKYPVRIVLYPSDGDREEEFAIAYDNSTDEKAQELYWTGWKTNMWRPIEMKYSTIEESINLSIKKFKTKEEAQIYIPILNVLFIKNNKPTE
jgi:hypothetical protein